VCPSSGMRRVIIGTAGHIDHGKTALVKALTGIDTDRLREEKERGISIDLGFAHLDLAGGVKVGVVDVPGHERFIKNMLAGVGGIDMVLFVVACDEGIMPQTREHFDIVSLLGVNHAVFALTKSDMVDRELVEAVREEVAEFIRDTRFKASPIIPTSVATGEGLPEMRKALEAMVAAVEERRIGEAVRLPIDRVFSMAGRGTVVTGTLWSGTIQQEARLEIQPGATPVRVRSIEVHGETVSEAMAGQRTALGIHGAEKAEIERGNCVVSAGDFEASSVLDLEILVLASAAKPLATRTRIRFHLGSSETIGRIFFLDRARLGPGERGFAQVRLEAPLVAGFRDRFVVRTYSPMRTIAGGSVLDPAASGRKRGDTRFIRTLEALARLDLGGAAEAHLRAFPRGARLEVLRKKLSCGLREIEAIVQELVKSGRAFQIPGGLYIHAECLAELEDGIEKMLLGHQAQNRLVWGISREELRERLGSIDTGVMNWLLGRLETGGRISIRKGSVRAGTGAVDLSPAEQRARSIILERLGRDLFQPPGEREIEAEARIPAEAFRKVMSLLVEDGEVIRLEPGLVIYKTAVDEAAARIGAYLGQHGEATAGDLKVLLGTTRKYAVPLLEHLDRIGVTRRKGDKRTLA
jgi:selenocysteine-specific elongation factor